LRSEEAPGEVHRFRAHLDADDGPLLPDARGEQVETSLRAAAELDHTSAWRDADLVEERRRLARQLTSLLLETPLLVGAVTEEVRIAHRGHQRLTRAQYAR
jgi:hypothetical protein